MKIVRFSADGTTPSLGVCTADERIVALPESLASQDLSALIAMGPDTFAKIAAHVETADSSVPLADVTLAAPFIPHRNIFCVGKNYRAHAEEFTKSGYDSSGAGAQAVPDAPIIFTKAPTCVIATGEPIPGYLDDTGTTDFEGELAVVIGKGGRGIAAADAMDHVFGYTIVNDVTARDLQQRHRQWFLGKSIDGFCPMGPCVVTRDAIPDIGAAELRAIVDGEVRQKSTIAHLIFDIPALIAEISKRITLLPGDVIATGTPEGVGIGSNPPRFLQAGQSVRVEIDGIGAIENVVAGAA